MKYGRTILTAIGVVAILVSFTSQAGATIIPDFPGLGIAINDPGHGHPTDLRPPGIFNNEHRKFQFSNWDNPHIVAGLFSIVWDIEANPDPFLHVVYNIKNISGSTEDFDVTFTLTITPSITGDSLTGGSISLTVIDTGGGGAELSSHSSGAPIYMSQIDGNPYEALLVSPQSFTTDPYGTTASGIVPEEFGSPIPSLLGPPVDSEIGIVLSGRLTSGDTAIMVATFVVTPEPGTMALLAIGGLTMMLRRRRQRA